MPKISAAGVPSYNGHEGVVQSASGLLYDVDPTEGDPVGGVQTGPTNAIHPGAGADAARNEDADEEKQAVRAREVGVVTPIEDEKPDEKDGDPNSDENQDKTEDEKPDAAKATTAPAKRTTAKK